MTDKKTVLFFGWVLVSGCFEEPPPLECYDSAPGGTTMDGGTSSGGTTGAMNTSTTTSTSTSTTGAGSTGGVCGGSTTGLPDPVCDDDWCADPKRCWDKPYVPGTSVAQPLPGIYGFARPPVEGLYSPCFYDVYNDVEYGSCGIGVCFSVQGGVSIAGSGSTGLTVGLCTRTCQSDADCPPPEGLENWPVFCGDPDPMNNNVRYCHLYGYMAYPTRCPAGYLYGSIGARKIGCVYVAP